MKWLDRTEAVRWNECRIRHNQGMGFGKSEFDPKEPFHVGEVLDQEYGLVQTFGIPMTAEPISKQYSEQRRSVVEKARQAWIRRLIDLSRRNNLLYYRPLKTGTLSLSLADGDRMVHLLQGESVSVTSLLEDPGDAGSSARLREIWRRAQTNAEEKGLATLFVALGMATWTATDGGRDPEAPALLLPVGLGARGRIGNLSSIRRTGTVQVNLVLLHVLETEFGIRLAEDDLIPLLQGDDEGESFDPSPVYNHLADQCNRIPGFRVK